MYSYTTVALAAATFVTFCQPCPAPPLAVAGLGTAIAGGAAGGVAQAVAGSAMGDSGSKKRDSGSASSGITQCISEATEKGVNVAPGDGTAIVVNGLPQSCLAEIQAYNADPKNGAMAEVHGTTTQINSTAVKLDGIPQDQLAKISDTIKALPHPAPQRRSMRFEKY